MTGHDLLRPKDFKRILQPGSLEPRKKTSECVTACAAVRKRSNYAVVDGVVFTFPSAVGH